MELNTDDMPEVNKELFGKIWNQILLHPDTHYQDTWETAYNVCGTTRCTAGWALHFTHPEDKSIYDTICRPEYANQGFEMSGKKLLGLTQQEAAYLFYADEAEALDMITHYARQGREGFDLPEDDDTW